MAPRWWGPCWRGPGIPGGKLTPPTRSLRKHQAGKLTKPAASIQRAPHLFMAARLNQGAEHMGFQNIANESEIAGNV